MSRKILIVGGVAGGASAAARLRRLKVKTYYNTNAHLLKHFVMFLAIVSRIKDHSGYHCIYRSLRISAKIGDITSQFLYQLFIALE